MPNDKILKISIPQTPYIIQFKVDKNDDIIWTSYKSLRGRSVHENFKIFLCLLNKIVFLVRIMVCTVRLIIRVMTNVVINLEIYPRFENLHVMNYNMNLNVAATNLTA